MIEFRNVYKAYDEKKVLCDFSLSIAEQSRICLMGESGSGKTTLLRLLLGLEKPDRGEIILPKQTRFSVVFQEDRLIPFLNALDNITAVGPDAATAEKALLTVGLEDCFQKYPQQLSGGMRRRLCLARAIAYDGDVFVLDEPLNGLDEKGRTALLQVVDEVCRGKTVLIVTHREDTADCLHAKVHRIKKYRL